MIYLLLFLLLASGEGRLNGHEELVSRSSPFVKEWTLPYLGEDSSITYVLDLSLDDPRQEIHFSVLGKDDVLTATLPHIINESTAVNLSETRTSSSLILCPSSGVDRYVIFSAWTTSNSTLSFKYKIRTISLNLAFDEPQTLDVSTGLPITLRVNPRLSSGNFLVLNVDSVDLHTHDICMVVAASEGRCPMKNSPETVLTSSVWQTALKSASITLRSDMFKEPFFVTIVVLPEDRQCSLNSSYNHHVKSNMNRTKKINIVVRESEGYLTYVFPIFFTLGCLLCIVLVSFLIMGTTDYSNESGERVYSFEPGISGLYCEEITTPYNTIQERVYPRVSDLSEISLRDNWFRRVRSRVYMYILPLITLYYFIPSIQFVFLAKAQEESSGSQDICYHNYKCSKPFWIFTDFNHIISNTSYFVYGFAFVTLVIIKKSKLPASQKYLGTSGILQQYSIFHALGFALMAQGLFSICYHVCPTNLSLQFDTTMMYIICVLSIVKLYQFRHPDVAARAYGAFGFVGVFVFLEALALYTTHWWTTALFFLFYIFTTLLVALDFLFLGIKKASLTTLHRIFFKCSEEDCFFKTRFICFLTFALCNTSYAVFFAISKFRDPGKSLSHVVLFILAGNLLLYLLYYIIRKIIQHSLSKDLHYPKHVFTLCRKTMTVRCPSGVIFGTLAILFGCCGLYFYASRSANRNLSPAESRNLNVHCSWLNFYDNHDIWHFVGASGVYFAFISLLSIDDDLIYTKRNQIDVF